MIGSGEPRVFVGVLRFDLMLPGARSLKDRRRVVVSLIDRIQHRFPVSAHDIDGDTNGRAVLVVTTAGNAPAQLRSALDRISTFVTEQGTAMVLDRVVDVFRWNPDAPEPWEDLDV